MNTVMTVSPIKKISKRSDFNHNNNIHNTRNKKNNMTKNVNININHNYIIRDDRNIIYDDNDVLNTHNDDTYEILLACNTSNDEYENDAIMIFNNSNDDHIDVDDIHSDNHNDNHKDDVDYNTQSQLRAKYQKTINNNNVTNLIINDPFDFDNVTRLTTPSPLSPSPTNTIDMLKSTAYSDNIDLETRIRHNNKIKEIMGSVKKEYKKNVQDATKRLNVYSNHILASSLLSHLDASDKVFQLFGNVNDNDDDEEINEKRRTEWLLQSQLCYLRDAIEADETKDDISNNNNHHHYYTNENNRYTIDDDKEFEEYDDEIMSINNSFDTLTHTISRPLPLKL
jgi:hypothetical protein